MDGGTVWNVNIISAIEGCQGKGYTNEQIVVDVLICNAPAMIEKLDKPPKNSMDAFMRQRAISKYHNGLDSIGTQIRAYPGVQWRYLIDQVDGYTGLNELKFDSEITWPLQESGRAQSLEVLDYGFGYGFNDYFDQMGNLKM